MTDTSHVHATVDDYGTVIFGQWLHGSIGPGGQWGFSLKRFDAPSEFGIDGGRISILNIRAIDGGYSPDLVNYSRGWDVLPLAAGDLREAYDAILELYN